MMVIVSALIVIIYLKKYKKKGILIWFFSNVFWALGFFLVFHQKEWPYFFGVILANVFILLSLSFYNISICKLIGKKVSYLLNFFPVAALFISYLFMEGTELLFLRIIIFSVAAAWILFKTGFNLVYQNYEYKNYHFLATGYLAFFTVFANIFRVAMTLYFPENFKVLIDAGNSAIFFLLLMLLLKTSFNIAYILILSSVALHDLKIVKEELEKSNSSKDKFFSIISHDMKNLFSGLLWLSNNLKTKIQEKKFNPETDYIRIETLNEVIQRQFSLLENLLLWASAQTNRIDLSPEVIDLSKLSNDIVSLYKEIADEKEIIIQSDLSKSNFVYADKEMVSTVIRNIVNNAIKFTPKSGTIKLYYSAHPEKDSVQLIVEDSGLGMTEENLNKLFKMDEKLTTKGTNNEIGTGLGLLVCSEFIKKNGGYINVESKEGIGSKFKITLRSTDQKNSKLA
ncbi:MAG: HAMP domain-containing histidine kinase [Leptospiraceae bacterium]|nr:HAMP domain-containing histidine kinase [Leptospiraceae bacterium]